MEPLPQLSEEEFEHIEETIAQTAKGRAFLRRYQRRAMGAAHEEIRGILREFRESWQHQFQAIETAQRITVLRRELMEMAASIEQARREVAALRPPDSGDNRILAATNELDAIVISTERASFEILNAAERLMDLASQLKETGNASEICAGIENEVTAIFTACTFQDLTGQRTSKVVNALRYIEQRISAMINIWGIDGVDVPTDEPDADEREDAHLLSGPQLEGHGVSQSDVDRMFESTPFASPSPSQPHSQSEIDNLFDEPVLAAPARASQSEIDNLFDSPPVKPIPAAPVVASQSEIDSLFDGPPAKPAAAEPAAAQPKAPLKPGKAKARTPVPLPEAPAKGPLDQSAIDALFG